MKKRKMIILLLFFVLIPFMVSAHNLEDLELKWTEEIEDDGYIFNPITELDPNYAEYYHGDNDSKFIETEDGYLIIGNSSFNLYDRKKGLVKSISTDNCRKYVKDGENYILIDFNPWIIDDYYVNVKKITPKLEILAEYEFSVSSLIDFSLEDDSFVVVYEEKADEGYYLNSLVLEKDSLKEKHSSKIFTLNSIYFYSKKIYYGHFNDNYYYLDDDFNIVSFNLNEDGTYLIVDGYSLYKYDKNGKELDSVSLGLSDGYSSYPSYYSAPVRKYNGFYYALNQEYKYDSASKKYLKRAVYYKYDEDLKLIDSKILTGESTTSLSKYIANLYLNKNGLFTYYSYNNQYYKIEDDFNFTTSSSSNAYDEEYYEEEPEMNNQLNVYLEAYEYLEQLASNKKEMLEKDLSENDRAYVYFSYDTYYDEDNEQLIIAVTWLENHYINWSHKYYTESELIYVDEENYKSPTRVTLSERVEYTATTYLNSDDIGAKMYADDDNIIVALGLGDKILVNIYDRAGKLIKTLSEKKVSDLLPQMVSYDNGRLLVVFSIYFEVKSSDDTIKFSGSNMVFTELAKKDDYLLSDMSRASDYSYIEYYETPFVITTKTDGNGTIESTKVKASSGDEIKFTITPKEGYVLGVVKVTDSSGNTVTFTDYTFTMPSSDVTIEATFVPENPNTTDIAIVVIIMIAAIASLYAYKTHQKARWLNS